MNRFCVYEHWRTDRDECFYVGKGTPARARDTRRKNKHHQAICAKVSREGHAVEVRIVSSGLSEACALALEIGRIAFWRAAGADLANMTLGGEGTSGHIHSEETRHKMRGSQAKRGPRAPFSEETKKKMGVANIGHKRRLGTTHTAEVKAKLSAHGLHNINIFKQYSALGPAATARAVMCIDDGNVFESASAASRHYNVARSALIELCLGKNGRKTTGGLRFKYVESA